MKKLLCLLGATLALASAGASQAAVIGFDTSAVIDIDNDTGQAVYREAGFSLSGPAASFLTIDGIGAGMSSGLFLGSGTTISVMADGGGQFSFAGLDAGGFDSATAMLSITGVFSDMTQVSSMVQLTALDSFSFNGLLGLSELRISADADVVLDNLGVASPVPEPGSTALLLLGVGTLLTMRRFAPTRAKL